MRVNTTDLEAITVRPRDKLLVRFAPSTSPDDIRAVSERLKERLPGIDVIAVNADQLVVRRAPDDAVNDPPAIRFADLETALANLGITHLNHVAEIKIKPNYITVTRYATRSGKRYLTDDRLDLARTGSVIDIGYEETP